MSESAGIAGNPARAISPDGTNRLETVQVLRFVAVPAVVFSHSFHELTALLADRGPGFDEKLFPGDFGVDLFFVISGFVMVHVSAGRFGRPRQTFEFLRRRLIRIVPLYWTATLAMIAVIVLLPGAVDSASRAPADWLLSFFFVPFERPGDGMMRPVLGLGWSLNYEMFFYAIFAACICLPRRFAIPAAIGVIFAVWLAGQGPLAQHAAVRFWSQPVIFEFAAGMAIGWAHGAGWRIGARAAGVLALAGIGLLAAAPRFDEAVEAMRHVAYGAPAALIVAAAVLARAAEGHRASPAFVAAGDASYSTYLAHPFVLGALTLGFAKSGLAQFLEPPALVSAYLGAAVVLSLAAGHATHRFYDRPLTSAISRRSRSEAERKLNAPFGAGSMAMAQDASVNR